MGGFHYLRESLFIFFQFEVEYLCNRVGDGSLASKYSFSGDQILSLKPPRISSGCFLPFFFFLNSISFRCLQSALSSLRGMLTCVCIGNGCYTAWTTVYLPPLWDKNQAGNMHTFGQCLETKCRLSHSGNIYFAYLGPETASVFLTLGNCYQIVVSLEQILGTATVIMYWIRRTFPFCYR